MQLIKNIIYNILAIQEKILSRRLSRTIGVKSASKRKRRFTNGCMLDLNTLAEAEKQKLEEELTLILENSDYMPEKILNYIEKQGTRVFYLANASKVLNPIGENEGFIYPASGAKALYLSLSTSQTIRFKTNEMFVLSKGEINKYYFIYHFYNWYAFKHNIAGMDSESQELLRKYLFSESDTTSLQLADIYKLKDAIKQDKASIEFVIRLCRNFEGAKQALDRLQSGGAKL